MTKTPQGWIDKVIRDEFLGQRILNLTLDINGGEGYILLLETSEGNQLAIDKNGEIKIT